MYYREHGVFGFVGEGEGRALSNCTTFTTFKRAFNTFRHTELLRGRGGGVQSARGGKYPSRSDVRSFESMDFADQFIFCRDRCVIVY